MSDITICVPDLPESVADATIAKWYKKIGETVTRDEVIVDIETDKIVLEVPAINDGVIEEINFKVGDTVHSGDVIGTIRPQDLTGQSTIVNETPIVLAINESRSGSTESYATPSARRLIAESGINLSDIPTESKHVSSSDVKNFLQTKLTKEMTNNIVTDPLNSSVAHRTEKRVPMSRLRQRVAERLLEAKNATAMLTTFNEVNMQPIIELRKKYGELFEKRHGIRLGYMSFFLKAVVEALKRYPEINASLDGNDIIYHNYFDVSIAISTPRGLVTPVLRDVDSQGMSDLENAINELTLKGREGKLTVDDLTGGTFTITNGGVFGSLMSTPIINPPQSAILGIHAIKERPMAVNGQVVILPMMYLALSYDHRIVDGKESIGFLVTIKQMLEEPTRLLLDI